MRYNLETLWLVVLIRVDSKLLGLRHRIHRYIEAKL